MNKMHPEEDEVDICMTCLSKQPPILPLREEVLSEGFETILSSAFKKQNNNIDDKEAGEAIKMTKEKIKQGFNKAVSYTNYCGNQLMLGNNDSMHSKDMEIRCGKDYLESSSGSSSSSSESETSYYSESADDEHTHTKDNDDHDHHDDDNTHEEEQEHHSNNNSFFSELEGDDDNDHDEKSIDDINDDYCIVHDESMSLEEESKKTSN